MTEWHADYWNQSAGERWARYQREMDEALMAFGDALLVAARLSPGMRVLDIGCGCGATTLGAAVSVGVGGSTVGIDVSRPMLRRAEERAQGIQNVHFLEGDAAAYAFVSAFDAMISRFGATFFAEPGAAFSHLRRQLEPGGSLTLVCWRALQDNEWLSVPLAAVRGILEPEAPRASPQLPGPFAFADPDYATSILADAGFRVLGVSDLRDDVVLSRDGLEKAVELVSVHAGPVGRLFARADQRKRDLAARALSDCLRPYLIDGSVRLQGAAWLVRAQGR